MPDRLQVIGLISGGKDSLYSLLHCLQNGHSVVALANLYPKSTKSEHSSKESVSIQAATIEDREGEDLNSFMYQTVGHSIIPLYAEALQLPLYRREIQGSAVTTDRDYSRTGIANAELDETEDLIPLLKAVLEAHPTANAISTGAIQSTYQRTRVESVALRLGLTPLGFLWQYPILPSPISRFDSVTGLLEDMQAAGCEARIIKIASGGIRERELWANVADTKTMNALIHGLSRFFGDHETGLRSAVVGEGGEFETLALCGPSELWKGGRIQVHVKPSDNWAGEGGTSYVKLGRAEVVPHEQSTNNCDDLASLVRVPALFDPRFQRLLKRMTLNTVAMPANCLSITTDQTATQLPHQACLISDTTIQISNLTAMSARSFSSTQPLSSTEQMSTIVAHLPALLLELSRKHNITPPLNASDVVHCVLLLRSMDLFAQVNPIYAKMFPSLIPNPPARVTISTPLPPAIDVSLNMTIDRGARCRRTGLHVQSRSYWAPANIGPYSQAISVPLTAEPTLTRASATKIVHIAGQLPLVPGTMEVSSGDFIEQATLSLQHLWRVGQEQQVDMWTTGVAFLARCPDTPTPTPTPPAPTSSTEQQQQQQQQQNSLYQDASTRAATAARIWKEAHTATLDVRSDHASDALKEDMDEEGVEVDVWELRNNHGYTAAATTMTTDTSSTGRHLHVLPKPIPTKMHGIKKVLTPAFIVAEVTALPRNASIEWWSWGVAQIANITSPSTSTSTSSKRFGKGIEFEAHRTASGAALSILTIHHHGDDDDDVNIQNERQNLHTSRFVTFVSMTMNMANANAAGKEEEEEEIEDLLSRHGITHEKDPTHGVAFVTNDVVDAGAFTSKQNTTTTTTPRGLLDTITVIPCHHIWTQDAVQQEEDEKENSSTTLTKANVAIMLRIDS